MDTIEIILNFIKKMNYLTKTRQGSSQVLACREQSARNQKVVRYIKRNIDRFPEDFMFRPTELESIELLRSQIATSIRT